jgi:hypothetical protein
MILIPEHSRPKQTECRPTLHSRYASPARSTASRIRSPLLPELRRPRTLRSPRSLKEIARTVPRQELLKTLAATVATLTDRLSSCKASGGAVSRLPPKDVMEQQVRGSSSALGKRQRLCESIVDYMLQDERGRMSREEIEFMLGISD